MLIGLGYVMALESSLGEDDGGHFRVTPTGPATVEGELVSNGAISSHWIQPYLVILFSALSPS